MHLKHDSKKCLMGSPANGIHATEKVKNSLPAPAIFIMLHVTGKLNSGY